jgi:hypothetical protein
MGKCFSNEAEVVHNEQLFNDFFYLCRSLKYLVRVSEDSISKFKYQNIVKIRKDSGVGYLSDGRIIVGGGTDSSGCLTKKVYLLDPVKSKVTILPELPVSAKEGNFFHFKDCIYYIAAVRDTDDEEILAQEKSAPIMKYFIETGSWEVFHDENEHKLNFQDFLKKTAIKMNESEEEDDQLSYQEILYPGAFMIGSKVFLINGQKMTSRGILKTMKTVFSINLDVDGFEFKVENFKSPVDSFRPVCGSYMKTAFITGGLLPSGKGCNFESFLVDFSSSQPEFQQFSGLKVDLDDNYPVICGSKTFIAIAFPNLAIFDREKCDWKHFCFDRTPVLRKDSSKNTPVLNTDAAQAGGTIKTNTNLAIFGSNAKIVNDDAHVGESLSEADVSVKVRLPPGLIIDQNVFKKREDFSESSRQSRSSRSSKSSKSSNTFSIEKRIPLPDSLKQEAQSSRSSSLSEKAALRFSLKNRPIAGQLMISSKPINELKLTNRSSESSVEIIKHHEIPKFSDSDSIITSEKKVIPVTIPKNSKSNKKKNSRTPSSSSVSSNSSSSSFQVESSISSVSSLNQIEKPMGQRLAPIKSGNFGMDLKALKFSCSEESSSESFAYENDES